MAVSAPGPIDRFLPSPDVRERHEITIRAPATIVFETARGINLQSLPLVRAIFWLRGKMLGAKAPEADWSRGFVDEALGMGWGVLAEDKGRLIVAGAACQPWKADVVFTPLPPDRFASYAEPDQVKIVWTMESREIEPAVSRFSTETRAAGTDEEARAKFRRYWRLFGIGILGIRWLLLPAVRREAERRHRERIGTAEKSG